MRHSLEFHLVGTEFGMRHRHGKGGEFPGCLVVRALGCHCSHCSGSTPGLRTKYPQAAK